MLIMTTKVDKRKLLIAAAAVIAAIAALLFLGGGDSRPTANMTTAPAADVVRECMARGGLCLTAKDKVRLLPALNIDQETLVRAVETIKAVAAELSKGDTQ